MIKIVVPVVEKPTFDEAKASFSMQKYPTKSGLENF